MISPLRETLLSLFRAYNCRGKPPFYILSFALCSFRKKPSLPLKKVDPLPVIITVGRCPKKRVQSYEPRKKGKATLKVRHLPFTL